MVLGLHYLASGVCTFVLVLALVLVSLFFWFWFGPELCFVIDLVLDVVLVLVLDFVSVSF